jgi:hypothetical protein
MLPVPPLVQIDELDLPNIGPQFETHPVFPAKTNTEFVEVLIVLAWLHTSDVCSAQYPADAEKLVSSCSGLLNRWVSGAPCVAPGADAF